MKAINKTAKKVMDKLTGLIDGANDHKILDNAKGTFMAVHVEHITQVKLGTLFSVTHYYEQNGDPMRDPDMEFIKAGDGEYYPISFWQDAPLVRDEAVAWTEEGVIQIRPKLQASLATFANKWMKNIKEQQGL